MSSFDFYFRPKFFEKSGRIYERIGIRFFKKYIPSGDFWVRLRGKKFIASYSDDALKDWEHETRYLEKLHTIAFFVCAILFLLIFIFDKISIGDILLVSWGNMLINFYPIILQRYNRARIYQILERREFLRKTIRRQ